MERVDRVDVPYIYDGNAVALVQRDDGPATGGIALVHMNIILNGEKREVPDNITIVGLLEFLNIQHQRVAVERNEVIVKKDRYGETAIAEGDALEVVSFMGGGCMDRADRVGVDSKRQHGCLGPQGAKHE